MEQFDITNYEQVMDEVIKYMDYLPDNDEERKRVLWSYIWMAFSGRGGG